MSAYSVGPAARSIALLMAEVRKAEDAARLEGYAEAEVMIAEGLRKLAEEEDVKAGEAYRRAQTSHIRHAIRAACLREAALAVSVGQFRDVPKGE